jgi:phage pi2 protein 07
LSLKTASATKQYTNLDIPEARILMNKHSGERSFPKILHTIRSMQDTIEEQMFHSRWTLQDITEIRIDNNDDGVTYFLFFFNECDSIFNLSQL